MKITATEKKAPLDGDKVSSEEALVVTTLTDAPEPLPLIKARRFSRWNLVVLGLEVFVAVSGMVNFTLGYEALPRDVRIYLPYVAALCCGGVVLVVLQLGFTVYLHKCTATSRNTRLAGNIAICTLVVLLLELPMFVMVCVAQVKGNCMLVDWQVSPVGQAVFLTSVFCMATRPLQLLSAYRSERNDAKWQRRGSLLTAVALCVFMTVILLSGKVLQNGFVHWYTRHQTFSERPVFLAQQVMPVCYDVTRRVEPAVGNILPPPSSIEENEYQENLERVKFPCCRFWQRAYVGTMREIAETPGGVTRRVKCQEAFKFVEYLVPAPDLPLLLTHHCTLVVRMSYDRSVGSLLYNAGIEYHNMDNTNECVTGMTNLKYSAKEYADVMRQKVARYGYKMSEATEFSKALDHYECPFSDTCDSVRFRDISASRYTMLTAIQPAGLNQHCGCYTQANGTALLDLGLCQGPPGVSTESPPYASFTSCIDDFDENEAESYIAYGTH